MATLTLLQALALQYFSETIVLTSLRFRPTLTVCHRHKTYRRRTRVEREEAPRHGLLQFRLCAEDRRLVVIDLDQELVMHLANQSRTTG